MSISLSVNQQTALDAIMDFFLNSDQTAFVFSGVAGSGKSTIISLCMEYLNEAELSVRVMALTGKAVSAIRSKGVHDAKTIHASIYRPLTDDDGNITGWNLAPKDDKNIEGIDAWIVDEAGMLDRAIVMDILSYGKPVLFVGDKEQLPPVNDDGFNIMDASMIHLDEVHRQAEGNPIILLSRDIRETGRISKKYAGDIIRFVSRGSFNVPWIKNNKPDAILCGTNNLRQRINGMARTAYGFYNEYPEVGETVMCLRNGIEKFGKNVYNGETFEVSSISDEFTHVEYDNKQRNVYPYHRYMLNRHSDAEIVKVAVPNAAFDEARLPRWKPREDGGKDLQLHNFTYGYACTVTKFQGSEAKHCCFVDEDVGYFIDRRKFRYTGVTRAREFLSIVES